MPTNKLGRTNVFQVSKKLFWMVSFAVVTVLIVLLVLTIYFGIKQSARNHTFNTVLTISSINETFLRTTSSNEIVTINTSSLPVARIPDTIQQLSYYLTITPNLINKTFEGDLLYTFRCLNDTNQIILHGESLIIDNSSIQIINSSNNSIPLFLSWTYDTYNQLMNFTFSSTFKSQTIYTVRIAYTGNINQELYGLYINHYVNVNGKKNMFMTSNIEPMGARNILPCIDEPARKAIFKISVIHDTSYTPWSNGEIERRDILDDGRMVSHFSPTLQMSTYLLALIVAPTSDFACLSERIVGSKATKSRVCGRVEILPQLIYADELAYKTLDFFNTYFNIDYPLSKIDHF